VSAPFLVHATTVAVGGKAVLLRGPSGSGKSDLALRLIDAGARLVADDQTELVRAGGMILARPPAAIAGLIEVRGIGIARMEPIMEAPLALLVDLVEREAVERLPPQRTERMLGIDLPLIALAPFDTSAPVKLRLALSVYTQPDVPALLKT
jgi:serine kinase of HPr protein (carbohydrate metabolism regulator)